MALGDGSIWLTSILVNHLRVSLLEEDWLGLDPSPSYIILMFSNLSILPLSLLSSITLHYQYHKAILKIKWDNTCLSFSKNLVDTQKIVDIICCCSVAKSCLTLWPHGLQHAKLPCPSLSPGVCSNESVMLSNPLILCCPLLLLSSVFPSIRVFSNELAVCIRCQSIGTSASASVLSMSIQCDFL